MGPTPEDATQPGKSSALKYSMRALSKYVRYIALLTWPNASMSPQRTGTSTTTGYPVSIACLDDAAGALLHGEAGVRPLDAADALDAALGEGVGGARRRDLLVAGDLVDLRDDVVDARGLLHRA